MKRILKQLVCQHDYQIMFRYPNVHNIVRHILPKGNVKDFDYKAFQDAPDFSGKRLKIKFCAKCGKEKVIK